MIWTVINVFFHVTLGMALALLLHRPLRGKGIYRALIILPWAIPQVIALLIWRTEYNNEYGAVNQLLGLLGLGPIPWLSDPFWNFVAMILTNVWLGVPFMMVIILGGLQSISEDYYEAAEIDGASSRQSFRNITLPLLRPVLVPAIILGTFLTFNNILVPFFINQNELETSDILVTALYSRRPSSTTATASRRPSRSSSSPSCSSSRSSTSEGPARLERSLRMSGPTPFPPLQLRRRRARPSVRRVAAAAHAGRTSRSTRLLILACVIAAVPDPARAQRRAAPRRTPPQTRVRDDPGGRHPRRRSSTSCSRPTCPTG